MDNRKRMFILVPVLILVWGVAIYRIYDAFSEHDLPVTNTVQGVLPIKKETVSYELALNYPDPFLKTRAPKPVSPRVKTAPKKVEKRPVGRTEVIPKPVLRYSGRVENRESKEERHLISVNGNPHIVTTGQEIDGVVLRKVFMDSVEFKWNNETIFVRR